MAAPDLVTHAKRRWWFAAVTAVLALLAVIAFTSLQDSTTHARAAHFVLHPSSSMDRALVPQAIAVLENDGPLVQTVLRVLESGEMLSRAATAAAIKDTSGLSLDATVSPSSAYFDVTVRGPEASSVQAVGAGLVDTAAEYVDRSYEGYELETLGIEDSEQHSFPPSSALLVLGLVGGAAVGLGIVSLEWLSVRRALPAAVIPPRKTDEPGREAARQAEPEQAAAKPTPARAPSRARATESQTGSTRAAKPKAEKAATTTTKRKPPAKSAGTTKRKPPAKSAGTTKRKPTTTKPDAATVVSPHEELPVQPTMRLLGPMPLAAGEPRADDEAQLPDASSEHDASPNGSGGTAQP